MKIRSFAGGGITYLPTSNRREEAAQTAASSSSSSSKVPGFADKIVDMIRENGVDVDVNNFLRQVQMTLDLANDPTGENLSMREIMALAGKANTVRNNFKAYENAQSSLTSKNAWGELALDGTGNMYVFNTKNGELETISTDKYKKNREIYSPLTNSDLLNQRRLNGNLAYNSSVLDDLTNVVSTEDILGNLRDIINNFKDTEVSGYLGKSKEGIKEGISEIVDGLINGGESTILKAIEAGPDGIYKINSKSTFADQNVESALKFLYQSIPPQHRRSIEAKAVVEGYDPYSYLLTMLVSNTGRKLTADFEEISNKANGTSGDITGSVQHTLAEGYADGQGLNPPTLLEITPAGSSSRLVRSGSNAGPILVDANGKAGNPIGVASVAQIIESGYGIGKVTRDMTVTFGDQLIDKSQLGGLVYTGSDMYRVVLPAKVSENGRDIIPDFELQQKLDNIVQTAQNSGEDGVAITRLLQQACPGAQYNEQTGGIILPKNRQHVFLTFEALGADNYIDFDGKSPYLTKSDEDPKAYQEATKYGYANHEKNDPKRVAGSASSSWFSRDRKHLYRGNVFMPITSSIAGAAQYNQEYIPKSAYTNITGRAIESERQAQVRERLSDTGNTNWGN